MNIVMHSSSYRKYLLIHLMDSTFASPQKREKEIRMEMKKVFTLFSVVFSQWNFHSKKGEAGNEF